MFIIPEVLSTLLMGLIIMVIVVVLVRPVVLHFIAEQMQDDSQEMQRLAIEAINQYLTQHAEQYVCQRMAQIRYQKLLLELPEKPTPLALNALELQVNSQEGQPDPAMQSQTEAARQGDIQQARMVAVIREMIQTDNK